MKRIITIIGIASFLFLLSISLAYAVGQYNTYQKNRAENENNRTNPTNSDLGIYVYTPDDPLRFESTCTFTDKLQCEDTWDKDCANMFGSAWRYQDKKLDWFYDSSKPICTSNGIINYLRW